MIPANDGEKGVGILCVKSGYGNLAIRSEQVTGVEPASPPWKGGIIPVYHTCIIKNFDECIIPQNLPITT